MENSLLNVGREHDKGQEELKRGLVELCETSHLIAKQAAENDLFFLLDFSGQDRGPEGLSGTCIMLWAVPSGRRRS